MSLYNNTQQVLRHYLASSVGDLIYGQAGTTGATTQKIYASFLWKPDDYYNEQFYEAYVYAGTNIGVTKRVTDWVLDTFLATVHSAYAAACDASSYVELHRIFFTDELNKAINLAIDSLALDYLIEKTDVTITLVADTYEYTLPADMYYVHRVITERTAAGGLFDEADVVDHRNWGLISPRKLKLDERYYSVSAGKDLRIEGQGRQALLASDSAICYMPTDWIVQKAITRLPFEKIKTNDLDATYRQAVAFSETKPRLSPRLDARKVIE